MALQTMFTMYRTTVFRLLDGLTFEQTEAIISHAQSIIDDVRGDIVNDEGEEII